jgi:hypothetical protein
MLTDFIHSGRKAENEAESGVTRWESVRPQAIKDSEDIQLARAVDGGGVG